MARPYHHDLPKVQQCFVSESDRILLFANRIEAGKRLASALSDFAGMKGVVLAIPRGGVVVGFEIARALSFVLDVIVPRKIGAPENPELAIGAVTEDGTMILDRDLIEYLEVSEAYIQKESKYQQSEIKRRIRLYRGNISRISLKNLNVIIVDDGIATGSTMKAALASVRKSRAKKVVIAVPVGPSSTIRELENQADQVICLYTPEPFQAIGEFYEDFSQTTDEEVKKLLKLARQKGNSPRVMR